MKRLEFVGVFFFQIVFFLLDQRQPSETVLFPYRLLTSLYTFLDLIAMFYLSVIWIPVSLSLFRTDMEERTGAGSWTSGSRSSKVTDHSNTTTRTLTLTLTFIVKCNITAIRRTPICCYYQYCISYTRDVLTCYVVRRLWRRKDVLQRWVHWHIFHVNMHTATIVVV